MNLDLQFKIKNDPNMTRYLRENSNWYKYLNRNPDYLSAFNEEMKEKYLLAANYNVKTETKTWR